LGREEGRKAASRLAGKCDRNEKREEKTRPMSFRTDGSLDRKKSGKRGRGVSKGTVLACAPVLSG